MIDICKMADSIREPVRKKGMVTMTETKKLYYENVYRKEFTATVLECTESEGKYRIILDIINNFSIMVVSNNIQGI